MKSTRGFGDDAFKSAPVPPAFAGELKLSGRPASVPITRTEPDAKELGFAEVELMAFANLSKITAGNASNLASMSGKLSAAQSPSAKSRGLRTGDSYMYAVVFFNNKRLLQTAPTQCEFDGTWTGESVKFRYPNNSSVYQCVLRIELFQFTSSGSVNSAAKSPTAIGRERAAKKMGHITLTGSALAKFISQPGMISKWVAVVPTGIDAPAAGQLFRKGSSFAVSTRGIEVTSTVATDYPELKIRAGPAGTEDLFEEDNLFIWLDIVAAVSVPQRNEELILKAAGINRVKGARRGGVVAQRADHKETSDSRPCPVCLIIWNGKIVGQTVAVQANANPIWEKQRFILALPLMDGVENVLSKCKLVIEVYDKLNPQTRSLIGKVSMGGMQINDFFGQRKAQIRWFDVALDKEVHIG